MATADGPFVHEFVANKLSRRDNVQEVRYKLPVPGVYFVDFFSKEEYGLPVLSSCGLAWMFDLIIMENVNVIYPSLIIPASSGAYAFY